MTFAEPGLVPFFEIEGTGLRAAALTIIPVEALGVTEVDCVGS
jgi:hypothetical protein